MSSGLDGVGCDHRPHNSLGTNMHMSDQLQCPPISVCTPAAESLTFCGSLHPPLLHCVLVFLSSFGRCAGRHSSHSSRGWAILDELHYRRLLWVADAASSHFELKALSC